MLRRRDGAVVLDGASREEAAKVGGIDRQTLRDWVIRFNEQGPDGLINIRMPRTILRSSGYRLCPVEQGAVLHVDSAEYHTASASGGRTCARP